MERVKISDNRFEYFETEQEKEKRLLEQDKDLIISDLIFENAELKQRLSDMEMIVADMLGGSI